MLIIQSHGGVAPIAESVRLAAGGVLSGPAGGVAGSRYAARLLGSGNLIPFDMGGTSTDISLIVDGEPALVSGRGIGGHRVALHSLDIVSLGAGGGSIGRVDAGGILHVGPESAGAVPGPACYGRGGTEPTVTDANLVLGYLDPEHFLGGRARLMRRAAEPRWIVWRRTSVDRIAAAEGVHRVVNTHMAEGIRLVSVRRGVDPRRFALLSFGGAAGLHVTDVARQLDLNRVVVPRLRPCCRPGACWQPICASRYRARISVTPPARWCRHQVAVRRDGAEGRHACARRSTDPSMCSARSKCAMASRSSKSPSRSITSTGPLTIRCHRSSSYSTTATRNSTPTLA